MVLKNISPSDLFIDKMVLKAPDDTDDKDGILEPGESVNLQYGNNNPNNILAMTTDDIKESRVLSYISTNKAIVVDDGVELSMEDSLNYYYMLDYVDNVNKTTKFFFDIFARPTLLVETFTNQTTITVQHNKGMNPLTSLFEIIDGIPSESDNNVVYAADKNSFTYNLTEGQPSSGFIIYKF